MPNDHSITPGVHLFWEQADLDSSDDHPLERELRHHVDAIARYQGMIADAEAMGLDSAVEQLTRQCAREQDVARELRAALHDRAGP
jgi:hypothetical protein